MPGAYEKEMTHIVTDLSKDGGSGSSLHPWNLHDAFDGLGVGCQMWLDLRGEGGLQALFEEGDMLHEMAQQDAMMGVYPSL